MNINDRIMDNKKLNLVEILKDCPKGTKLYSPMFGECVLADVKSYPYSIRVCYRKGGIESYCDFTEEGKYFLECKDGECLLFPSKENRDWSTFKVEKPKWNPNTLQPFDKVLARDEETEFWGGNFYLYTDKESGSEFIYSCVRENYKNCIPYNEDTKHLLGTNQEAPEFYRV